MSPEERDAETGLPGRAFGDAGTRGVARAVEAVRGYIARKLGWTVAAWVAAFALLILALAPWLAGSAGWSPGSRIPLVFALLLIAAMVVALWAWRKGLTEWGGEVSVARAMDHAAHLPAGSVLGSLELSRVLPPGTSGRLRDEALRTVSAHLDGGPEKLAGALGARVQELFRRATRSLFVLTPLIAIGVLLAPDRTLNAWRGMLAPWSVLSEPRLPPLSVTPGTVEVQRGSAVDIEVGAPGRPSVSVHWEMTGQVVQSLRIDLTDGTGSATLPPITASVRYWAQAPDGARTAVHTLTPVDPLFVSTYVIEAFYPGYTGLGAEEFRNEIPELVLPAGTRLVIRGQGSRTVAAADLRDDEGEPVLALDVEGLGFSGSWTPSRSGVYHWNFVDESGAEAAVVPDPLRLRITRDSIPQIALVSPGPDTVLPVDLRQPLVVRATDDYGLDRLEIVARRVTQFGESMEPQTRSLDLGGAPAAVARPILDVSDWGVTPGDTIRYRLQAVDIHPSGQVGATPEFVLRVPLMSELQRAAEAELDQAAERMQELAEEAARAEEEARDLMRQGEQARERNGQAEGAEFEEREEVGQALQRQRDMLRAVDSLQAELSELRRALNDAGLADPELREELQGLEDLLGEVDPEEGMDDATREALERLAEMDPAEMEALLEQMAQDQERMREQLEDSIDQFRQAAIEQDFRATSQEAEELAQGQELLAEAMQEGGDPELRADQQADLEERAEDLQEQLEQLQQRLDEAGEQQAGAGVQEARHQLSQARAQMQQAAQMAQQGNQQSAGDQAQEAAQDLSEVSQELNEAQQQMQQQMAEALQRALGKTANDALSLARRQAELREEMQGKNQAELAELRGDEAALAQGIRNLAENYALGTQMAAPGSRDLMAAIGEAMEGLDGTIDAMEGRRGRTPSPMSTAEEVIRA